VRCVSPRPLLFLLYHALIRTQEDFFNKCTGCGLSITETAEEQRFDNDGKLRIPSCFSYLLYLLFDTQKIVGTEDASRVACVG
jgi:hypothetical protein